MSSRLLYYNNRSRFGNIRDQNSHIYTVSLSFLLSTLIYVYRRSYNRNTSVQKTRGDVPSRKPNSILQGWVFDQSFNPCSTPPRNPFERAHSAPRTQPNLPYHRPTPRISPFNVDFSPPLRVFVAG